MNAISAEIAAAIEQQGVAAGAISGNVRQTARSTEEVSRNIAGVSEASAEVGHAATQVLDATANLAALSDRLEREVRAFLDRVRAA